MLGFGKKDDKPEVDAVLNENKEDWNLAGYFFAEGTTSHIGLDMEEVSEYYAGQTVEINFYDDESVIVQFDSDGNPVVK